MPSEDRKSKPKITLQNNLSGIEKFANEISKTGFVLESKIVSLLKKEGWIVISNKYYEDDYEGSVREIDLLAYKVRKVQSFDVYTTLIISCKKNSAHTWAFLARDLEANAMNTNLWPLHIWTNYKPLSFQLSIPSCAKNYHQDIAKLGVNQALALPEVDVFAFQEMDSSTGVPKNDKEIYQSITSLLKAQAYEISALPQRKNKRSVYQFNLISVVDAELVRLKFDDTQEVKATQIDQEQYISRYIIKRKESTSRVRFIKADKFSEYLKDYNKLHDSNCKWLNASCEKFYKGILKDSARTQVLIDEFRSFLEFRLGWRIKDITGQEYDIKELYLSYNAKEEKASVIVNFGGAHLEALNADSRARDAVLEALNIIYRYTGDIMFEEDWDIPF